MAFRTNKTPILQTKSASGAVATFNTALAMPLPSCNIAVNAWQEGSGDPSPVNVRNIVPRREVNIYQRGINLWDEEWELGSIDNTTGQPTPSNSRIRSKNYIPVAPNTQYYMTVTSGYRYAYDINKTYIGTFNIDNPTPSNCYFIKFRMSNDYGTTYNHDISINYPSTDTSYHAYDANSNSKVVNLGEDTYGAVYNSVTGVKNDNKVKIVIDGTEDLRMAHQNYIKEDACDCYYVDNNIYPLISFSNQPETLSNKLKFSNEVIWSSSGHPNTFTINNRQIHLNIANDLLGITDYTQETLTTALAKIKAFLETNNIEILIPVTETETQLTPTQIETLIGNNTIFADTGDVDLTFKDLDIAKRGNFREVFRLPS